MQMMAWDRRRKIYAWWRKDSTPKMDGTSETAQACEDLLSVIPGKGTYARGPREGP